MKQLLFAFMLFATIKSNGQQKSYLINTSFSDNIFKKLYDTGKNAGKQYVPNDYFLSSQTNHTGFYLSNEQTPMVAEYIYGNDTLYVYPSDKIKFIKIGERIYKIESPTLMEIKRESNGYWLGNTFTMDTTIVKPMFEYNLINSDTLPLSKKPIKH